MLGEHTVLIRDGKVADVIPGRAKLVAGYDYVTKRTPGMAGSQDHRDAA